MSHVCERSSIHSGSDLGYVHRRRNDVLFTTRTTSYLLGALCFVLMALILLPTSATVHLSNLDSDYR